MKMFFNSLSIHASKVLDKVHHLTQSGFTVSYAWNQLFEVWVALSTDMEKSGFLDPEKHLPLVRNKVEKFSRNAELEQHDYEN